MRWAAMACAAELLVGREAGDFCCAGAAGTLLEGLLGDGQADILQVIVWRNTGMLRKKSR